MSHLDLLEDNFKHSAERLDKPSPYLRRKARNNYHELERAITSKTVYVGNLSHFTTEEQIHELFSKCGAIDRIIMGLDRNKLTPCGFCFVIYRTEQGSLNAMKFLQATILDSQSISIDLDPGFREGRQFGRGKHGGQAGQEAAAAVAAAASGGYRGGFRGGHRGGFRGRGRGGFRGGRGGGYPRGEGSVYIPSQDPGFNSQSFGGEGDNR
ncbi:uncharacterized protein SPAPADRAFT_131749 [Spathaspora passalidarum NRRL Y-27907]|uniref:Nuclear cap-binding protein subunit 2 n=1 Tax=Spathaspora passalidarum (strain NRRL Y-27907 / 11-Y1) TaxID=619300 RepID=G3AFS0_SPAPN|nr:uncharacterized protein SPAPADRAFT_131749 [Spathaspora passalidarum NRRL Y-27907]EGW35059.1 hypothetical protein SPAPADRAFT_131749 [Spathaspora passalidarum NRRL Y-27907]